MPSTLSQTDLCNLALAKVGAPTINDISDTQNPSAVACNTSWQQAVEEVARAHTWNCLMRPAVLSATPQTPISASSSAASTPWAPSTSYAANVFATFGNALYQALIAHISSASFINDLTAGFWFETDVFNSDPFGNIGCGGGNYPSGWAYAYPLPSDFILLATLNDQWCDQAEVQFQIMGTTLYTNDSQAVIKYVAQPLDTTVFDSLFNAAFVFLLASKIATILRQDSASIASGMQADYSKALREARVKDAGERKPRRFQPVNNSRFVASRWGSTNN